MSIVRPVTRDDAAAWLRMREALWPEYGESYHPQEVAQYFDGTLDMPLEVLIAIDAGGNPLGFAELSIRAYAEGCSTNRVAFLEGWYVVPEARRSGIGRSLVQAAEAWAIRQGCTEFASDSLLENTVSAAAHRALGFEEVEQIRCYRKSPPPA